GAERGRSSSVRSSFVLASRGSRQASSSRLQFLLERPVRRQVSSLRRRARERFEGGVDGGARFVEAAGALEQLGGARPPRLRPRRGAREPVDARERGVPITR